MSVPNPRQFTATGQSVFSPGTGDYPNATITGGNAPHLKKDEILFVRGQNSIVCVGKRLHVKGCVFGAVTIVRPHRTGQPGQAT